MSATGASAVCGVIPADSGAPTRRGGRSGWLRRPSGGRLAIELAPPLVYLGLALILFSHFLAHPDRGVPGGADGVIYSWYFRLIEQALAHGHNPFFSTLLNAPTGVSVMWNTAVFALAVICAPLTALIGPFATVGLLMMIAPVLSAWALYYALRRVTAQRRAGAGWLGVLGPALAAALYGFGPYFVGQNGHLHLTFAVFPPLLLLWGHRLLIERDESPLRIGVKLGVASGLLLLVSEEIVALTAVVAAIAVVLMAATNPTRARQTWRRAVHGLLVAAVITVIIGAVPLGLQLFGRLSLKHGVPSTAIRLDLAGVVRPGQLQYYSSEASRAANAHFPASAVENTGYLGWPLVAIIVLGCGYLFWRRDRFVWWWLPTMLLTVLLSMGSPLTVAGHRLMPGPWQLIRRLPLLDGAVVVRFSLLTTLLLALLLTWLLAALRGRTLVIGLVVLAAAFIPLRPAGAYGAIEAIDTPRFFSTSAVDAIRPGSTALLLPVGSNPDGWVKPMTWQLRADLRFGIIGGYSVFNRAGVMSYAPTLPDYAVLLRTVGDSGVRPSAASVSAAKSSVAASGTDYVVITAQQPHAALVSEIAADVTGCTPRPVADVTLCQVP